MEAIRVRFAGDRGAFQADIKQLMFNNDTPIIVSEDSGTFAMVMYAFQHYENTVSTYNNRQSNKFVFLS